MMLRISSESVFSKKGIDLALVLVMTLSISVFPTQAQKSKQPKKQTVQNPSSKSENKKSQETSGENTREASARVHDIIAFLAYVLNTIGSDSTSSRDKDVLITESYTKIFRDAKVQVEDDLDEERTVITNKDVVAYLKDVDFFFRNVSFEFIIEDISESTLPGGEKFYKVSLKRNLQGITADGAKVSSIKPRFIEINFNPVDQDLKIVSIYTNEFNEKEALTRWWNDLSFEWKSVFREKAGLQDSVLLQDIKNVTAISDLDLSDNRYIQNIEPLGQLYDLKLLSLSNTHITDLTPIRNLTSLLELDLSNTKVQDLAPLKYSSGLQRLNLSNTLVSDVSVLEKMGSLKNLDLSGSAVTDFTPLRFIPGLTYLNLKRTQIADLSVVSHFSQLVELNVAETPVHDLKPLESLSSLQLLFTDSTQVEDIAPLSKLPDLRVLHANFTRISNLRPLHDLQKLEKIYCDQTGVRKNTADSFMASNPGVLVIYDSKDLKNWWDGLTHEWQYVLSKQAGIRLNPEKEELARVTNLDSVNITGNKAIKSLEPLRKLTKIKRVKASGAPISDLLPIKDHRYITELDVSETAVSDLAVVAAFPGLKILHADHTPVESIEALKNARSLEKLYVDHTTIQDIAAREFMEANTQCLIIYKSLHLRSWWDELSQEWKEVFRGQLGKDTVTTRENLHRLTGQRRLSFSNFNVKDLSPLSEFVVLSSLQFSGTGVNGIPFLENLKRLRILHATNSPLRDIEAIARFDQLEELDISNTAVEDLGPLDRLGSLRELNCSGTQIRKLDPVERLSALEMLDCSNTRVSSLKPLYDLPLRTLKCYNTRINSREVGKFMEKKKDCNVIYYR